MQQSVTSLKHYRLVLVGKDLYLQVGERHQPGQRLQMLCSYISISKNCRDPCWPKLKVCVSAARIARSSVAKPSGVLLISFSSMGQSWLRGILLELGTHSGGARVSCMGTCEVITDLRSGMQMPLEEPWNGDSECKHTHSYRCSRVQSMGMLTAVVALASMCGYSQNNHGVKAWSMGVLEMTIKLGSGACTGFCMVTVLVLGCHTSRFLYSGAVISLSLGVRAVMITT